MNEIKSIVILLIFILKCCMLMGVQSSDIDGNLNELYKNLLQREYTDPISFPNHQVERKAQRSPSLRLRFGRRSDPSLYSSSSLYEKRFNDEINKKPIRSPSLRLRFGKRDPSNLYPIYDDNHYANEIDNLKNVINEVQHNNNNQPFSTHDHNYPWFTDSSSIGRYSAQSIPAMMLRNDMDEQRILDDAEDTINENLLNPIDFNNNKNNNNGVIDSTMTDGQLNGQLIKPSGLLFGTQKHLNEQLSALTNNNNNQNPNQPLDNLSLLLHQSYLKSEIEKRRPRLLLRFGRSFLKNKQTNNNDIQDAQNIEAAIIHNPTINNPFVNVKNSSSD